MCPNDIFFHKKDISKKIVGIGKFDIIILSGVLSIFSDGEKIIKNLISLLKPNGKIFIFEALNTYSYNLFIKSENLNVAPKSIWFKNMYSTNFIKKVAKKNKKKCKFFKFKLKTKLKKNKTNLNIGWTEYLSGKKIITNGLGIIQNQFWVKIY